MPSWGYRVWQIYIYTFGAHTLTRCTWKRRLKTAAAWTCRHVNGKLKGNLVSCNLVANYHMTFEWEFDRRQISKHRRMKQTYIRDIDELKPNLSCEHCMACTYSLQIIVIGFQYITVDDNSSQLGKKSTQTKSTSTIFEFSVENRHYKVSLYKTNIKLK